MSSLSCLLEIQHRYPLLTPAEKKVADYISRNSKNVIMMPVDELAKETGTAKSAVIRCSKSLGFDGYADLKISLSADVARSGNTDYSNSIDADEPADSIVNKVFTANIHTLQETQRLLDITVLEDIAQNLASANMIYIYGIGSSGIIGEDFQHRLFQMGYSAVALSDITAMKDSTMLLKEGDVAFAFSNSGRTIPTVETMQLARENGAMTICLTGYTDSPITKVCDLALFTSANEFKYPIESFSSRVARYAVIDALIITLSTVNYERSLEKMNKTRELVKETRYSKNGETRL